MSNQLYRIVKKIFDNWNKDCKRHRCARCKRVRAQSQMRASRSQTKNRRDAKWFCIDCNSRKLKKPVKQWEPETKADGRDINFPHRQISILDELEDINPKTKKP